LYSNHTIHDFTEGNSWQYTWFVPQNPEDLVSMMGGKENFIRRLDSLFNTSEKVQGAEASPDISGMVGQYAQGNEPSHHVAYLYNVVGEQEKTQEIIHRICTTLYSNKPDGLCGNEDCGEMSAWYVFSTMGFFPMNPADGLYQIGTPAFNKLSINVPGGKVFTVTTENLTDKNFYIKSVTLNGEPLDRTYITHQEILDGGEMHIVMK
jgi:predicted alpha-1,2-mannosidase